MAMLTVIILLSVANFYFLLKEFGRTMWRSGFFWVSVTALSLIFFTYARGLF